MWDFATTNPGYAFLIVVMLGLVAESCITKPFGRLMRHLNVRRAGWPPAHLDADGDWKPKED
jgi:hypothetical protein